MPTAPAVNQDIHVQPSGSENAPINIGLSCNALKQGGGMERYALDLVRGFHRAGVPLAVFAKHFETALCDDTQIEQCKISVGWLPQKLRDLFFSYWLQRKKRQYGVDLLIGCNRVSSADIAICGGTHIGFLRALRQKPGIADRLHIWLERKQYANAKHIIAHSRAMRNELCTDYGIAEGKITLAYPPTDTSRFHVVDTETRDALREQFGFPKQKVVFLFPSSSHVRKGYPLLAEFFKKTDLPVILAVVGRPMHSNSPNIRYLGFRPDIETCYQAADFTILASHYEPFGLVGIESVLCGTPVVMAKNSGCLEILSDSVQKTFHSRSLESLAHAIQTAVQARMGRDMRIDNPAAHIQASMDIASHVQCMLAIGVRIA